MRQTAKGGSTIDTFSRLSRAGIIPVVALEHAEDAVPTAKALLAGGIDVMEITFRTGAAAAAIKAVAEGCPEMLVGAGTVVSIAQCQEATAMGAGFLVSPGFSEDIVRWGLAGGLPVIPGCVTPTEIMAAQRLGLQVVKFFPAGVYGGLAAMKALAGPFGGMKFIPTGGVNAENLPQYAAAPFVYAVGGSWICTRKDIAGGNFERITALCAEAVRLWRQAK